MRGFIISLIVLFLGTTINLVISETSGNSKQLNSDDYDDDSEDFDDSPEDQELQLEDKRPSYLRVNRISFFFNSFSILLTFVLLYNRITFFK